jgi:hypothetical protein
MKLQEREQNLIPDSNLASDLISMNTLFGASSESVKMLFFLGVG